VISRNKLFRSGVLLVAAVLIGGCLGGRSPDVQFYNLSATDASSTASSGSEPAIVVGPVIFPRSLRRSQIVIRTGPNSVELDEFHRWAGSLESDFLDTLGANLGALLSTDRVAVYPAEAMFAVDYRISLQVERFDGAPGGSLVLNARWTVSSEGGEKAAAVGHSVIEETVAGDTVDDLVQAHDAAVGKLSMEIATRIKAL